MRYLYAPWRDTYITKLARRRSIESGAAPCLFCTQFTEQDNAKNFILLQGKHAVVMLNLYPYNRGHLLVLSRTHVGSITELSAEEYQEFMKYLQLATQIVQRVLIADGVNVGINMGKAAGAGLPDHLHAHVLPRWWGDTNFLPLLAETKAISFDIHDIYVRLLPEFQKVGGA